MLAPLYWIYDSPVDLVIAQGVLFALAIPPIWAFTRREFGDGRAGAVAGYAVAVAYGLSWPIASAAAFPFHEAAWAPLLMAVALERLQKKRLRGALIALGLLLVVKEDMGLFVAGLGLGLIFARWPGLARQRLVGLGLFGVGLVYTVTAVWVFIPAMGGQSYYYWAYSELGQNVPQAVKHILTHPLGSAKLLITPHVKVRTTLELFGPFFFLALLSPVVLAAAPLLLERMLANTAGAWWVTGFQYNSFVIVPIALAAVQGASRLQGWAGRILGSSRVRAALARVRLRHLAGATTWAAGKIAVGFALLFGLFSIALVRQFAFDPMFHVSFYQSDRHRDRGGGGRLACPEWRRRRGRQRRRPAPRQPRHRPALGRRRQDTGLHPLGDSQCDPAAVHVLLGQGTGAARRSPPCSRLHHRVPGRWCNCAARAGCRWRRRRRVQQGIP